MTLALVEVVVDPPEASDTDIPDGVVDTPEAVGLGPALEALPEEEAPWIGVISANVISPAPACLEILAEADEPGLEVP